MLKYLFGLFRPKIEAWITTRALTLPQAKRAEWSRLLGVSEESLRLHEVLLAQYAISQLDRIIS